MLVIQVNDAQAPEGAKKLYRHAMVSEGTLFLYDFSNNGTTINKNIGNQGDPVFNLAREVSEPLGVDANGVITLVNELEPYITEGGGYVMPFGIAGNRKGVSMPLDLPQYLYENQPDSIFTAWVRLIDETSSNHGAGLVSYNGNQPDESANNIYLASVNESLAFRFGGAAVDFRYTSSPAGKLTHLAIAKIGNEAFFYLDGVPVETFPAAGFSEVTHNGFGLLSTPRAFRGAMYQLLVEDLTVSGRTPEEVITKERDYVYGVGEFAGIPQRPFLDTY